MGAFSEHLTKQAYEHGYKEGYQDGLIKARDTYLAIKNKIRAGLSVDEAMLELNVQEKYRPLYKRLFP